jgi:hypothetical protein
MQPPISTQIAPAISTPKPKPPAELDPIEAAPPSIKVAHPPIEEDKSEKTKVKRLVKLNEIPISVQQMIAQELMANIDNPFFKGGGRGLITYKDPKMKFLAKDGNVFEDVQAPHRRASSKKRSDEPPPPAEAPEAPVQATMVRALAQLASISAEDKAIIMNELKQGIENQFYRLLGKGIGYKDSSKMKKRAKKVNVFEDVQEPPTAPQAAITPTEAPAEVPASTVDVGAAPSANEVAAIEQRVRPHPIKKRVFDLRKEARFHDLIDKGFGGGMGDCPSYAPAGPPICGHRRLDLSGLNGKLDLGEHRISIKMGGQL